MITLEELAELYNFNMEDVVFYSTGETNLSQRPDSPITNHLYGNNGITKDIPTNQYFRIRLVNGDWIEIFHPHYSKYHVNNSSIRKALTKKLHDMREEGVKRKERELKSMKREIKTSK